MDWLKKSIPGYEKASFIIGSDRWMGGKAQEKELYSTTTSTSGTSANAAADATPSQYTAMTGLRVRSPSKSGTADHSGSESPPSYSKLYPDIYSDPAVSSGSPSAPPQMPEDVGDVVVAEERGLVRIPGAMAHLIDEQQSVLLSSGDFSCFELLQNGNAVAVFARVGNDLQWPVVKDQATAKLDASHYFFSIKVDPTGEEDAEGISQQAEGLPIPSSPNQGPEVLNYGVTFKVEGNEVELEKLDKLLEQYSFFSAPVIVKATPENIAKVEAAKEAEKDVSLPPAVVPEVDKEMPSEEVSKAYWTTIAPNVGDYNSGLARAIAAGGGTIIRCIFWCSDTTVAQLEKGGKFIRQNTKQCAAPSEINPKTLKNIRRVKRITRMSQRVAAGLLSGVVKTTGFFTSSIVNSRAGKKFFKLLPGEVALASLDAFGRLFDALEAAGQNVLSTTSVVTSGVVHHRYGEKAAEATNEGLQTVGYAFSTAWTLSKIRKALNPKSVLKTSNVIRTAANEVKGK